VTQHGVLAPNSEPSVGATQSTASVDNPPSGRISAGIVASENGTGLDQRVGASPDADSPGSLHSLRTAQTARASLEGVGVDELTQSAAGINDSFKSALMSPVHSDDDERDSVSTGSHVRVASFALPYVDALEREPSHEERDSADASPAACSGDLSTFRPEQSLDGRVPPTHASSESGGGLRPPSSLAQSQYATIAAAAAAAAASAHLRGMPVSQWPGASLGTQGVRVNQYASPAMPPPQFVAAHMAAMNVSSPGQGSPLTHQQLMLFHQMQQQQLFQQQQHQKLALLQQHQQQQLLRSSATAQGGQGGGGALPVSSGGYVGYPLQPQYAPRPMWMPMTPLPVMHPSHMHLLASPPATSPMLSHGGPTSWFCGDVCKTSSGAENFAILGTVLCHWLTCRHTCTGAFLELPFSCSFAPNKPRDWPTPLA